MSDRGASEYSGKGPLHPALSRPPPSSERYPSEARRRPRGAATGSRGSIFPEEDEGRAILKRRRVEKHDRMRKRERETGRRGEYKLFSFSLVSFLPSPAAHPSIDRRATLLRAAFVSSPPAAFPSSFLAKPSRHADPTGILNARREADCLTAYAKPRSLDDGMAAREISTRK